MSKAPECRRRAKVGLGKATAGSFSECSCYADVAGGAVGSHGRGKERLDAGVNRGPTSPQGGIGGKGDQRGSQAKCITLHSKLAMAKGEQARLESTF
ncbi:hypothetical protein ACLOJK_026362 [Asimina triloba]